MGGFFPGEGVGVGGGGTADNTTEERIPYKSGIEFDNSPLYFDVSENKVVSDVTVEIPGGTLKVGEITNVSSSTGQLIVENELSGGISYTAFSTFDTAGSSTPCFLGLGAEYTLPIETGSLEVFSANPLTFSLTGTATLPNVRQVNAVTLKTGAVLTNFRATFTDNATGLILRYLPSKAEWDAGTGLTTASGDNFFDFINTGTDSPGTYYLGVHPFIIENGQQIDIEFRADTMNILGEIFPVPLPYLILEVQDGPFLNVVTEDVDGNITTSGSLDVQGNLNVDGTITSTSTENLLVTDDFIHLNFGYETVSATEGGISHVYLPTSENDAIEGGPFTPGVAAVSNPTVGTVSESLFSANDIVQIYNTNQNNGIFEVLSHTGNLLTVKGVGLTPPVEAFSNNQFVSDTDDGNIRKINVTVLQSNTSGNWQTGKGSVTGITYTDLSTLSSPASSTVGGVAYFDVTTGDSIVDSDNFYYDDTTKIVTVKPDAAGTCSFDVDDSSGVSKIIMGYDEASDAASIVAPTTDLVLSTSNEIVMGNDVSLADNTLIKIGSSDDFQISHDGSVTTLFQITQGDLKIQNTDTNGDIYIQLPTTTETDRFFVEDSASGLLFYVGGSGQAAFTNNLGIGRETPATSVLHVYENTTDTTTSAGVRIENAGTGDALLRFFAGAQTVTMGVDNSATDTFRISMGESFNSGVAITIDSLEDITTGGRLGISKAPVSPYVLDVDTSLSTKVRIRDDKAVTFEAGNYGVSSTDLYFNRGDVGVNQSEFVMYNIDDNFFAERFFKFAYTGTAGGLTIQNTTNNVGIGVDLPDSRFHVYESTATAGAETGVTIQQNGIGDALLQFLLTGGQRWVMGIDNSDSDKFKIAQTVDLNTNAVMTIDTSGNTGIGTVTPASPLHVYENTTAVGNAAGLTIENAGTGDAMIQLVTSDERWIIRNDNSNNDRLIIGDDGDNARIVFDVTQKIRVDNRLVVGDTDSTGVEITESGGVSTVIGQTNSLVVGTDSASDFTLETDSIDAIKINGTDQYVAVGQGTALTQLHVFGDATIDGVVYPEKVVGYIKNGETGFAERHISTGDFIDTTISLTATGNIYGAWWGKDGTRLYVTTNAAYIYQYDLTVPYDLTTATFTASNNFTDPNNSDGYTLWNDDGSKFWHGGRGTRTVTLTTPWEISGIASDTGNFTLSFQDPLNMYDLRWNFDGTKIIGVGRFLNVYSGQSFLEWDCTTPYLLTSRTSSVATSYVFPSGVPTGADVVKGFDISPDGMRVYLSAPSLGTEYEIALETAWDLSSGTLVNTVTRVNHTDINNYSMAPDASGMVSVTAAGTIVQKKFGLEANVFKVDSYADFTAQTTAPNYAEGRLFYDDTDKSLSYQTSESDVTCNIGKEVYVPPLIKNDQGTAITNGQVVYVSGSDGTYLECKLAQANSKTTSRVVGMVTQASIANGSTGYCTTYGLVRGLNTAAFTAGDTVYLSTSVAGGLQNTLPTWPNCAIEIGFVVTVDASDGTVFIDHAREIEANGSSPVTKSYAMADYGTTDGNYVGGYYEYSATSVTLTIGGTTTQTFSTANQSKAAHAFVVFGGTGNGSLVLTVSGTSITDAGVRTTGDSEDIYSGISAVNDYWETSRKWLGQITYTLTGTTGSYVFNYGLAKYEDFENQDFTVTSIEAVGKANANASNTDIILYHHNDQGWTYSAAAFKPDPTVICQMSTDHSTDRSITSDGYFAYKRAGLTFSVVGSGLEGVIIEFNQATNNALWYANFHIGVRL